MSLWTNDCSKYIPTFLVLLVKQQIVGSPKPWQRLEVTQKANTYCCGWWYPASWQQCWFSPQFLQELLSGSGRKNITAGSCPLQWCHWLSLQDSKMLQILFRPRENISGDRWGAVPDLHYFFFFPVNHWTEFSQHVLFRADRNVSNSNSDSSS